MKDPLKNDIVPDDNTSHSMRRDYEGPALSFESITFSDETTISFEKNDVVVLVGPNNAGKSQALRDIHNFIGRDYSGTVLKSARCRRHGTKSQFVKFLEIHAERKDKGENAAYEGDGFTVGASPKNIEDLWEGDQMRGLVDIFSRTLEVHDRIQRSNPVESIGLPGRPHHPIHTIFINDSLEYSISNLFKKVFGKELILYRAGGRFWPLYVGDRPSLQPGEDRVSTTYANKILEVAKPLEYQGDGMRSFASVILHLLVPNTPTILIIDEPEAFLHPPQSRLLGEILAGHRESHIQVFIATHSSHVLDGIISVASNRLRLLRIERKNDINSVAELDKELARRLSANSLIRFSSVLSGIYHERVIVCESDSDCTFYSSILNLPQVHGSQNPDVLFVHANGKERVPQVVEALRSMNVQVDVILDIDIFQSVELFKKTIRTLGGNWNSMERRVLAVKSTGDRSDVTLDVNKLINEIGKFLSRASNDDEVLNMLKTGVVKIIKEAKSPWNNIKKRGISAMPECLVEDVTHILSVCSELGLWIVPVGELEGFCRSINLHGPKWAQCVIVERDLAIDEELEEARRFMTEIWSKRGPSSV